MENNAVPKDYDSLLTEYLELKSAVDYKRSTGSKFAERVRYDFNTLLNSITGYMYAAYENADHAQRPAISNALKTSKLLLGKVNEVSDYFALVFNGYKADMAASSIRLMVRQLNQEFDDMLATKNLRLASELDARIPEYVVTEFNVVKKALSRLVENAVQHTPSGEVKLSVSVISEQKGVYTLKFSIADEGDGERTDAINAALSSTGEDKAQEGFPGIGLQVAKDFLGLLGSSITAEKNDNNGVTVSFIIDVKSVMEGASGVSAETEESIPSKKALSGVRVLLADDSVIMQQIVRQMLEGAGATVIVASNGEEAVLLFGESSCDIVLMDIEMPVLNGYGATRKISELKKEHGIKTPVIGMTAHTGREEYDKCIESGMSSVVIKPFKYNEIMGALFQSLFNKEYVPAPEDENTEESSVYKFDKILGIDHREGVKRLGGNDKVYFELLQNFRDGYKDIAATISGLIKEGHDNEVKNLLHMMKGISGNLSFNEVYDYANRLKESIEQDNIMDITKYLRLFGDAINEFVTSFEAAEVEILYNMAELVDMDLYLVKTRIAELKDYLSGEVDLGNAIDACDDIYDCIKEPGEKESFERIRDAVYSFNMELAADQLKTFMSKYL